MSQTSIEPGERAFHAWRWRQSPGRQSSGADDCLKKAQVWVYPETMHARRHDLASIEKEAGMARDFSDGFPGQAPGKGNSPVIDAPGEAPPVDVSNLSDPENKPVSPVTDPAFEPATGLPMIPAEQAREHVPFDEEDGFPGEPEFLDFF